MIGLRPLRGWWLRTVQDGWQLYGWCLGMLKASKIGSLSNEKIKISFHRKRKVVVQNSVVISTKSNMHQLNSQPFPRKNAPFVRQKAARIVGFPPKVPRNRGKFQSSWGPILHLLDPFFVGIPHSHLHSLGNRDETRDLGNPWSTFWIPMGYKRRRLSGGLWRPFFWKIDESLLGDWFGQPSLSTKGCVFCKKEFQTTQGTATIESFIGRKNSGITQNQPGRKAGYQKPHRKPWKTYRSAFATQFFSRFFTKPCYIDTNSWVLFRIGEGWHAWKPSKSLFKKALDSGPCIPKVFQKSWMIFGQVTRVSMGITAIHLTLVGAPRWKIFGRNDGCGTSSLPLSFCFWGDPWLEFCFEHNFQNSIVRLLFMLLEMNLSLR